MPDVVEPTAQDVLEELLDQLAPFVLLRRDEARERILEIESEVASSLRGQLTPDEREQWKEQIRALQESFDAARSALRAADPFIRQVVGAHSLDAWLRLGSDKLAPLSAAASRQGRPRGVGEVEAQLALHCAVLVAEARLEPVSTTVGGGLLWFAADLLRYLARSGAGGSSALVADETRTKMVNPLKKVLGRVARLRPLPAPQHGPPAPVRVGDALNELVAIAKAELAHESTEERRTFLRGEFESFRALLWLP